MSTRAPESLVVILSSSAGSWSKYSSRVFDAALNPSQSQVEEMIKSMDEMNKPMTSFIHMTSFHKTDPTTGRADTGSSGRVASDTFKKATREHFETENLGVLSKAKRLLQWEGTTDAIKEWVQNSTAKDPALTVVLLDTDKDECKDAIQAWAEYKGYGDTRGIHDFDLEPEEFGLFLNRVGQWKV